MKNYRKFSSGFSLIELCTVLSILVILILAIFPIYRDAVLKTRRAEARSALYSVMLQQERFYTQHHTYSAFTSATANSLLKSPTNSHYEISATPCQGQQLGQCVLLTARPNQEKIVHFDDPVCGNLMLDSTNNKTYSKATKPNSLCW